MPQLKVLFHFGLGTVAVPLCFLCQYVGKIQNAAVKTLLGLFAAGERPGSGLSVDYTGLISPEAGYSIFHHECLCNRDIITSGIEKQLLPRGLKHFQILNYSKKSKRAEILVCTGMC